MSNILRAVIQADVAKQKQLQHKQELLKTASRVEDFLKRAQTAPIGPPAPPHPTVDTPTSDASYQVWKNNITKEKQHPSGATSQQGGGWHGAKIDPVFQTMLGVAPDGKLGPKTQAALDSYKQSRGNPGMSNEEAFSALKLEPNNLYAYRGTLPRDSSGNYNSNAGNQQQPQSQPAQFAPGGYRVPISTTFNRPGEQQEQNKPASRNPMNINKLSQAKSDPKIQQIQQMLKEQGYNVTVDGIMGPATKAALDQWSAKLIQTQAPAAPATAAQPAAAQPAAAQPAAAQPAAAQPAQPAPAKAATRSSLNKIAEEVEQALLSLAKKDKGHNSFVFPKTHPKVKDNKDHFPIGSEAHGRSALQEMGKYTSAPKWYSGSLEGLKSAISRAVHAKYPGIKSEKKK